MPRHPVVRLDACELDLIRRRARFADHTTKLTWRDVQVLQYLLDRTGDVVSREEIERDVWELNPNVRSDAVPIALRRLRGKIERDPSNPTHLQTVHGVGWRFQLAEARTPHAGNLPSTKGDFVGRSAELAALDGGMTVTGPPGVGKTRLVIEWARQQPGEVWYVDAARGERNERTAAALGLRTQTDAGLATALAGRGPVVLVVDGTSVPQGWLADCPDLRWVAVNRGTDGDVQLGPLPFDDAVRLLQSRLSEPAPLEDVQRLARAVHGLPLALEMCASRARLLSIADLADRVDARSLEPVRAAFEWSWDQLGPAHRTVLVASCAFAGPFSIAAAEAICDRDVLEVIDDLERRSLVRIVPAGCSAVPAVRSLLADHVDDELRDRHARWYLARGERLVAQLATSAGVEALRQLTRDADEIDAARRHARGDDRARLALVQSAWLHHAGAPSRRLEVLADLAPSESLLGRVLGERGHVHTIVGDLDAARDDLERAIELDPSARNWRFRGFLHLRLGEDEAAEAATRSGLGADGDAEVRGTLYGDLGVVLTRLGKQGEAAAAFRHGLGILQDAGNTLREGWLRLLTADHYTYFNDFAAAELEAERARSIHEANGAEVLLGYAEILLGGICLQQNKLDAAHHWLEASSDRLRRLGEDAYLILALNNLADLHLERDDYEACVLACTEAVRLSQREGLRRYRAVILITQATAYRLMDAPELARHCLEGVVDSGSRRETAYAEAHLAALAADAGRLDDAAEHLIRAEAALDDLGDPNAAAVVQLSRGHLAHARGEPTNALQAVSKQQEDSLDVRVATILLRRVLDR